MEYDSAKRKLGNRIKIIGVCLACVVMVSACSTPHTRKDSAPKKPSTRIDRAEKVIPKIEPRSKYGNPDSYVVFGQRYYVLPSANGYMEQGIASWYGTKFHGRRTSSGETYDMYAMTAAHKTLPLPTYARVTNKRNGRSIIVRINDRGPFHENRIIDLSYAAATKLGIVTTGTGLVEVRAIDPRQSSLAIKSNKTNKPALPEDVVDVAEPASSVEIFEPLQNAKEVEKNLAIYVQLGAFRSKENAYKLRNQYAAYQLGKIHVNQQVFENEPIYKVWVGPLSTVEESDSVVGKITKLGHVKYKIVFENQ